MRLHMLLALSLLPFVCHNANAQVCGRVDGAPKPPTAADALGALRASVGTPGACGLCLCDVDTSGAVAAVDALAILRKAVGLPAPFVCGECLCPAPRRVPVGAHPRVVRAADFDGDGNVDLVTSEDEARELSMLMGTSDGSFQERRAIEIDAAPMSVVVADLDGDEKLDLVTANLDPSSISVFRGNGNGRFEAPRLLASGNSPVAVVAGDFSGDGRPDLLTVNSLSNDVSVYLAADAGAYTEGPRLRVGVGPRWIELADLTGDGKLDAVTANRDSHDLTILPGNGDGTFADARRVPACAGAHQALPADLNRDSKIDLVVPCKADAAVAVLIATGGGVFEPARLYPTDAAPIAAAFGDLDGDGNLDVAVTHWYPGRLVLLRGVGDGTFVEASRTRAGAKVRGVVVADVTGDDVADVVAAGTESNDVVIFPGNRVLATSPAVTGGVGFRPRVRDITAADFDGDGSLDLLSANWHAKTGIFSPSDSFNPTTLIDTVRFPSAAVTGDFNGDDHVDFVLKNNKVWSEDQSKRCSDPHLAFFAGNGDATFQPELRVAAANLSHHTDDDFAAADVNADGIDDLVIIERKSAAVTYMRGQANGQFEVMQRIPVDTDVAHLAVGDINGDREPDVAFVQETGSRDLLVYLHNEFLRYPGAPNATIPVSTPVSWLLIGDLNGDGRGDLITGRTGNTRVEARLSLPDNAFSAAVESDVGIEFFKAPTIADADRDGALDLVGLHLDRPFDVNLPLGGPPAIARGSGAGGFGRAAIVDPSNVDPFLRRFPTTGLLPVNLDGDPAIDFVVSYHSNKDATRGVILYNAGHCTAPATQVQ